MEVRKSGQGLNDMTQKAASNNNDEKALDQLEDEKLKKIIQDIDKGLHSLVEEKEKNSESISQFL